MENTDSVPQEPVKKPSLWRVLVIGRNPTTTVIRALVSAAILVAIFRFILLPVRVSGISMQPTYRNGTINFVNRAAFWLREPQRGDVVGYAITGQHVMLFKRVIALPGETIEIRDGTVFINDAELEEPYLQFRARWNTEPVELGANEFFLIGDNRGMGQTEHEFGRGPRSNILGKALW
jgi:signal peptidase I